MNNRKTNIKIILIFVVFVGAFGLARGTEAANWYVRPSGGTSGGTSWTDSWNGMGGIKWASVQPGDTIWLAGGTYGGLTINKSGTSGSRIYIKRVLSTDAVPVAAAGWSSSYDSQVVINNSQINWPSTTSNLGSFVTIDGRIDSGIRVFKGDSTAWNNTVIWIANPAEGIELKYLDIAGPDLTGDGTFMFGSAMPGITFYNSYGTAKNVYVGHCRIHGVVLTIFAMSLNGGIFEYNKLYDTVPGNSSVHHNDTAAVRNCWGALIWRYNEVWNGGAEGWMLGAVQNGDTPCKNEFYGNLMHSPHNGGSSWRFVEPQWQPWQVVAYNNTIVGTPMGFSQSHFGVGYPYTNGYAAGSYIGNNLFINVISPLNGVSAPHDYNAFSGTNAFGEANGQTGLTTSIFASYAGDDYRLSSATKAGYSLSAPYNADISGLTRGSDGVWDRGAYEYSSSGTPAADTTAPAVPSGLAVN